jgi:hypothetical protein
MEKQCKLGKGSDKMVYSGNTIDLIPWEKHGVYLYKKGQLTEVGCIDAQTATVTGKSNTSEIEKGDVLEHNPEICESGIRRYKD